MAAVRDSLLGEIMYHIGHALGEIEAVIASKAGAAGVDGFLDDDDGARFGFHDGREAADIRDMLRAAGKAWLVTRVLRPRPVRWPRVVLAGLAATAAADLVGRLLEDPDGVEHRHAQDPAELVGRFTAGIATAAAYAAVLYPRLPGSSFARGLAFGALEMLASPYGGVFALGRELSPSLRYPLQTLMLPLDEDAGAVEPLVFGTVLGLLYRDGGDYEDDDGEAYDDD